MSKVKEEAEWYIKTLDSEAFLSSHILWGEGRKQSKRVLLLAEALEQQIAQLQLLSNLVEEDSTVIATIEASIGLIEEALKRAEEVK